MHRASIGRRAHYLDTFYTRQDCYYFTFNLNILSYNKSLTTLVCAPWLSSENEVGPINRYFRKKCGSHLLSGMGSRDRPNRMDSSKGRKIYREMVHAFARRSDGPLWSTSKQKRSTSRLALAGGDFSCGSTVSSNGTAEKKRHVIRKLKSLSPFSSFLFWGDRWHGQQSVNNDKLQTCGDHRVESRSR